MDAQEVQQDVEYVSEQLDLKGAAFEAFSDVFARFQLPPEENAVRLFVSPHTELHHSSFVDLVRTPNHMKT